MNPLVDTWQVHNRINLYVLEAIPEALYAATSPAKGRNVGAQLAHLHNVRLMWLKAAAPDLLPTLTKIEPEMPLTAALLREHLTQSGEAISELLSRSISIGKIKNFKPHPTAFMAYLIAHESHHRGQILLIMKENGYKIDRSVGFGMWEWGTR
ncbi:MAG: hypothetical protein EBZ77_15645 [Chitinophagia bacterium]|nr:hypothetical protein [Chitinophagia bacterium]